MTKPETKPDHSQPRQGTAEPAPETAPSEGGAESTAARLRQENLELRRRLAEIEAMFRAASAGSGAAQSMDSRPGGQPEERAEIGLAVSDPTDGEQEEQPNRRLDQQRIAAGQREATQRQELEGALRATEAQYQDLYDNSPDMHASIDVGAGAVIECNLTFAKKLGYEKSEVLGRDIYAFYDPACVPRAKAAMNAFTATGEAHNVELQFHRKAGNPVDVMLTASAMRGANGEILRARCVWRDITERRQDIVYRRRLAAIVDASRDAIVGKSLDGRIVSWNPGAERLYGYKAEEVIGQSFHLLTPEEKLSELEALHESIRRGEEARHFETVRLRKGGRHIHVSLTASPIRDDHGAPVGVSMIARDITERKRQEMALRSSEERLRSLVRTAMDAVITIDMHGLVLEWNRAAEETFGYTRQEALGRRLSELIVPPSFRDAQEEGLARFRQTGDGPVLNQRIEILALHRSGREFPVELSIAPAQMGDETVFNAFVRDITDRRLFQKRLARQALEARLLHEVAALAAESRSFDDALQRSIDMVCELTGWPLGHVYVPSQHPDRPGLVSTDIWSVNDSGIYDALLDESERARFAKGEGLPGRIWQSGEPAWINDVYEDDNFPRARKNQNLGVKGAFGFPVVVDGKTEAVLEFFSTQATEPDENLLAIVRSVGQQLGRVIERRRAEKILRARARELALANDRLLQSNQELDDFAYVASHDLREPLRGIHNYATFLVEDYADVMEPPARQKLETLQRLAQRMDQLIDSLLQFSRVGRVELAVRETDLNDVLLEVLDSMHISLEEHQTEVRVPQRLPVVVCDAVRIGEVFRNLITNAMKYNDKPDKWIEIGMMAAHDVADDSQDVEVKPMAGEQPVFYVRDNGIGIRAKHLNAVFRIFKRLHGRDKFGGGTGAGLTIVKKIVARHGGRVWVESTYGQGTTFFFTLRESEQRHNVHQARPAHAGHRG